MRFRLEGNGPESHQVRRAAGVFRVSSYLFQVRPLYPCCSLREVFDFLKTVRSPEHRLAWLVAIAADAIQIGALPLFAAGGLSPADALLDLGVAAILIRLLGWHWAFLPTLLAELLPGFDLFPTWTAAVFYVTRQRVAPRSQRFCLQDPLPRVEPRRYRYLFDESLSQTRISPQLFQLILNGFLRGV